MKVTLQRNPAKTAKGFVLITKDLYKKIESGEVKELVIKDTNDKTIIDSGMSKLKFSPAGDMIAVQFDEAENYQNETKKKKRKK